MSCPDENVLLEYVRDAAPAELVAAIQIHFETCSRCRALVLAMLPQVSNGETTTPPQPADSDALVSRGTAVGRYIVLDHLGSGGMGIVYSAYDPELDRKVALKLIHAAASSADSDSSRSRLLREAQAMARLAHPNVVHVYDVGIWNQQVFVAMEYVDGGTLRRWLRDRPRPWRQVLAAFVAAGRGLAAAHAAGLVHRDFKPDNVLIGRDGRARVTDFGLVRPAVAEPGASPELPPSPSSPLYEEITRTGTLVGTPAYMAPEQMLGEDCDARSDVFAFCVALYEGLYGERPFSARTVAELAAQIARGQLRKPPPTAVPVRLRNSLVRGLSAKPASRHATMDALLAELTWDSATSRRRWLQSGLVLALLSTVTVSWLVVRRAEHRLCQGGARKLDGVWDAQRRQRVSEAFLATRAPFAATAADVITRELDRAAAAWLAMYVDACEATHVRGEQSAELLDLRMDCLENQRRSLAAVTSLFSRADAQIVEKAAETTAALGLVQECADTASLRAATRPPADALVKKRVGELRDQLAAIEALRFAGKYEEAIAQATGVVERARALGYLPVDAEAELALGRLQRRLRQRDAAKTLSQAVIAAEASHHDRVAAQAWMERVDVDAYTVESFAAAHEDVQHADAYLARMAPDDALRAHASSVAGTLLLNEGKLQEARVPLERALAAARRAYGEEHPRVAYCWQQIGFVLTGTGEPAAGENAIRRAVAINEKLLGAEHPDTAQSLIALAIQLVAKSNRDESVATFRRAIAIIEKAHGPVSNDLIMPLSRLGDLLTAGGPGAMREALALQERAVAIARVLHPKGSELGYALGLLSSAYKADGRHRKALEAIDEAQAIVEPIVGRKNPYFAWMVLTARGDVLSEMHRYAEAAADFEEALSVVNQPLSIAVVRFDLAQALWELGRERPRAVSLSKQAREYWQAQHDSEQVTAIDKWLAKHHDSRH